VSGFFFGELKERLAVVFFGQISVGLDEGNPFSRQVFFYENGADWTFGLTGTAIDALIGVNEHGQL
jgi:hypothetical protein